MGCLCKILPIQGSGIYEEEVERLYEPLVVVDSKETAFPDITKLMYASTETMIACTKLEKQMETR